MTRTSERRDGLRGVWIAAAIGSLVSSASPAAPLAATPTVDTPSPALCTAEPRSSAEIDALLADAVGAATPAPARTGVLPAGTPADAATGEAVAATIREWVACQNAGEPLRSYRLFTDSYLRRLLYRQGPFSPEVYDALATPMPAPSDKRVAIVSIGAARLLPDGRVGSVVTLAYPSVPMPKTFFFTLARDGDGWRIDGILGEISFSVP